MTAVDVAALEAARAAATAGPWGLDFNEWMDGSRIASMTDDREITGEIRWNDAVLISAMHTALPDLLAAVRERDALRAAVEALAEVRLSPDRQLVAIRRGDNTWHVSNGGHYRDKHVEGWTPLAAVEVDR